MIAITQERGRTEHRRNHVPADVDGGDEPLADRPRPEGVQIPRHRRQVVPERNPNLREGVRGATGLASHAEDSPPQTNHTPEIDSRADRIGRPGRRLHPLLGAPYSHSKAGQ